MYFCDFENLNIKELKEQEKMISKVESTNEKMESQLKSQIEDDDRRDQVEKIMQEVNTSEINILKKLSERLLVTPAFEVFAR